MPTLADWNVVVSTDEGAYKNAIRLLKQLGNVAKTDYHNVLVMRVADICEALEALRRRGDTDPEILRSVRHFVPVTIGFTFMSPAEFELKAKDAALAFLPQLAGKSFYVRLRRRGFKGRLEAHYEERMLGDSLLDALARAGSSARVTFDDPDAIVIVETVGQHAGLAVWTREDMQRYPFLRLAH